MENSSSLNRTEGPMVRLDRESPYLRLQSATVYVRDQDLSLRFYLDQLGFTLAYDAQIRPELRLVAVAPPDGDAVLAMLAPAPGSEEYKLIGHAGYISFVTEDVTAKFNEWSKRGVHFHHPPR